LPAARQAALIDDLLHIKANLAVADAAVKAPFRSHEKN
jgi:hypothetical protein